MSNLSCARGFGEEWDGTYEILNFDTYEKIPERNFWVYRNSFKWFISASPFKYDISLRKAERDYPGISDPTGDYTGVAGNPDGNIANGSC